jgi:diguanylate cyclase (GGDEF)-like protein
VHPAFQIENEVWNLPKYLVAIGMVLLMLENQIQHSQYLALHDDLTGLPNRRLFQDRLDMAIARCQRSRGQLALLLIDLDHFKHVNDTFGHHAGDEVLRRVSSAFLTRLRRSDTLARTGGDEFSLILEEPDQAASAEMVAESLHALLREPIHYEGNMLTISASIGIAYYPQDASTLDGLCIVADDRMYRAKDQSRSEGQTSMKRKVRDMQT